MTKTWHEKQKDLYHTAVGAHTWIKEKLKKGDIDSDLVEDDLVFTLKKLKRSLGGTGIQSFVHGHSIFPRNGFQIVDPSDIRAPFYGLSGPDQTWAWEVYCMSCINFPDDLPVIILLAKKQATHKGIVLADIMEMSEEDKKLMQDIQCHPGIVRDEYSVSRIIDALRNANLLCEVGDRLYATVVDGNGRWLRSLFDAGSVAEVVLDELRHTEKLDDDDRLSVLIDDLGIRLSFLAHSLKKDYVMNGKKLLESARDNHRNRLICGDIRQQEIVKQKETEYKNCLLSDEYEWL